MRGKEPESIGSIRLCKNRKKTFYRLLYHFLPIKRKSKRPELGDSQAGDKVGDSKTGRKQGWCKHWCKQQKDY